jgi:hypothetical protein
MSLINPEANTRPELKDTGHAADASLTELKRRLRQLVADDPVIKGLRTAEKLSEEEATQKCEAELKRNISIVRPRLELFKGAEQKRDKFLRRTRSWRSVLGLILIAISVLALLAGFVGLFATNLNGFAVLIFGGLVLEFLGLGAIFWGSADPALSEAKKWAAMAQSLEKKLSEMLRSLVIIPALEKSAQLRFECPSADVVHLTDSPSLSSVINSNGLGRIQTRSYREVFMNLGRLGGAAIGLSGSRGIGKSELLRAFCSEPSDGPSAEKGPSADKGPSVENGGVIGIIIPAPVAYQPQPFLRILIRKLAEAVPEYNEQAVSNPHPSIRSWSVAALLAALVCVLAGAALISNVHISHRAVGYTLLVISVLLFIVFAVGFFAGAQRSSLSSRKKHSSGKGAEINEANRRQIAVEAAQVARRIRYIETRSFSSESSASWRGIGFKGTAGMSLGQVPLNEPDLVEEMKKLVLRLHDAGYEVRIGIDELDKLTQGDDAEKFLTGIKVLFTIQECSFILTISEDASAQFARRGMPVRDVFESSLDTVVQVKPLSYREARRLVRSRLSEDSADQQVSDTQVALCYCLAGGLPRDFLRFCRQLGETNLVQGGEQCLEEIMGCLLEQECKYRVDGIRLGSRSRDDGERGVAFIVELDRITAAINSRGTAISFANFFDQDRSFASAVRSPDEGNTYYGHDNSIQETGAVQDINWIRDTRRQLYTYLYFIEAIRELFSKIAEPHNNPRFRDRENSADKVEEDENGADTLIKRCEDLANARNRMEIDAAAGWRAIAAARQGWGCQLQPCAHELNPGDPVWSHLKQSLAKRVKHNIAPLTVRAKTRLQRMQ